MILSNPTEYDKLRLGNNFEIYKQTCIRKQISEIEPDIFISGSEVFLYPENITQLGITHLLCVSEDAYNESRSGINFLIEDCEKSPKIDYKCVFMQDNCRENILRPDALPVTLEYIHDTLQDSNVNTKILVYCQMGVSRSVAVVVGYFMWRDSLSYDDALCKIRKNRPKANPNTGFEKSLRENPIVINNHK
jgi:protein-tyrosine phosphatase